MKNKRKKILATLLCLVLVFSMLTPITALAEDPPTYIELPNGGTGYIVRSLEDWEHIVPQLGTRTDIAGLWLELEAEITVPGFTAPLRTFAIYGNGGELRTFNVIVPAEADLTLNNVNIIGTATGHRLRVTGVATMNGGSFGSSFTGTAHVTIENGGTFNLLDGIVNSNTGASNGVVDLQNNATFNMYGGTVRRTGGSTNASTGTVRFAGTAANMPSYFNMYGGLVEGAPRGVTIAGAHATFNMYGGEVVGTERAVLIGGHDTQHAHSRTFNYYGGKIATVGVHATANIAANGFITAHEPLAAEVFIGRLAAGGTGIALIASNVTMSGTFTGPVTVDRGGVLNVTEVFNGNITRIGGAVNVSGIVNGCVAGEYNIVDDGVVTHLPGEKVIYIEPTWTEYGIWHIYCEECGKLLEYGLIDPDPPAVFSGTNPNQLNAALAAGNVNLTTPGNYGISQGVTLRIPEGRTLYVSSVLNVRRDATLLIEGTVIVLEGGRINNDGHPTAGGGTIIVANGGKLINNGYIESVSRSFIYNEGTITNNGTTGNLGRFEIRALTTFQGGGTVDGTRDLNFHRDAIR